MSDTPENRGFDGPHPTPAHQPKGRAKHDPPVAARHDKPWMNSFGKLRDLRSETHRINRIIEQAFGRIEPEAWT
jgi:hypothetical protein